ncbi:MAG: hypothetical protein QOK11_2667 [Pseudonocardiales bacterium]|nr:hypothetical protein [Pseudonocardiales bacterium]
MQPNDPYRYGLPVPPVSSGPTGKEILGASWTLLRQDRELLALPFISALAGLAAAALLFVPGWAIGTAVSGSGRSGLTVGGVAAVFAMSIVAIYFQAALVVGANMRADGGTPTLGTVLRQTSRLFRPIIAWALLTTTVGVALRIAEQRLGILGKIVGFLGGVAWAIASFLAVPVVVAEGLGPIAAVKRSAELVRTTWGTGLRTTLRFGLIQFLLTLPALIVGVIGFAALFSGTTAGVVVGMVLIAAAVLALFVLGAVFNAVFSYARAMIYRYATGRPVPGIPHAAFAGAFAPKRRRRRA